MFSISFYLISGMMVGVEIQKRLDTGNRVLVIDLFIVRFMFEKESEEED
jgi:hypothetical protein